MKPFQVLTKSFDQKISVGLFSSIFAAPIIEWGGKQKIADTSERLSGI